VIHEHGSYILNTCYIIQIENQGNEKTKFEIERKIITQ